MKRILTPPKKCEGCGDWMFRKHRGYQLEPPTMFARRRFHDNQCKGSGALRGRMTNGRDCLQCGEEIVRKKFRSGYEPRKQFRRRRFCSAPCWFLWLGDPANRAQHGAKISAAAARRRRQLEAQRVNQARYAERRKQRLAAWR